MTSKSIIILYTIVFFILFSTFYFLSKHTFINSLLLSFSISVCSAATVIFANKYLKKMRLIKILLIAKAFYSLNYFILLK